MDVASCAIIAVLFLLHITRLNHQVGPRLLRCMPSASESRVKDLSPVALEALLPAACLPRARSAWNA